jgi:hypothetical protein
MAGEQPRAEGYNWVVPSHQRTSWAMHKLVSLLLLLTESQGSGATLGSLNFSPHHRTDGFATRGVLCYNCSIGFDLGFPPLW